jgi:hypothetical protein|tara:strand:- start:840 stop:1184 length:345 start_codon:yes stop_codon:yes gene_type:complete
MDATHLDLKREDYTCFGCYLLDIGQGGENQLGHMGPGGCLYEEENFSYDDLSSNNEDVKQEEEIHVSNLKNCIVCCDQIKNDEDNLICNFCQTKENKQREIRYQTFIANNYAKS